VAGSEEEGLGSGVGITGHQRIDPPELWLAIESRMKALIASFPTPLVGYSSLAPGADQLFANVVLQTGGRLYVVLPFAGYETRLSHEEDRARLQRLLSSAAKIEILPRAGTDEQCYMRAGQRVVDLAEIVIAVWDGKPAGGLGGTADVVRYAEGIGRQLIQIDPYLLRSR